MPAFMNNTMVTTISSLAAVRAAWAARPAIRICVTLNAPEDWNDHKRLYDWGFGHYVSRDVCKTLSYRLPVYGGDRREIELRAEPLELLLPKDAELRLRLELPGYVLAPVRKGEIGGQVTVLRDGRVLGSAALRFTEEVKIEEKRS